MRVALGVEYDGAAFSGWQSQVGTRTVQDCLEQALAQVADHPLRVVTAGRTDAGVHACAQVVHFDTQAQRPRQAWVRGTATHLPADVSPLWAREVAPDFHARFSALARTYRYVIFNRKQRPTFLRGRVSWEHRPLDAERMRNAALCLLGEQDFSAFRAAGCQAKTAIRTIERIHVWREDRFVFIEVQANAFLQHMVRNIAGVLMQVGSGEAAPGWVAEVLATRDRTRGGVTATPQGLYLLGVRYPPQFGLPEPEMHLPMPEPA
ncbi:MAG: tRNA pseudouridine(38-40) synthase TruA [Gammaproteobacteria bacterium]|jgi:tRNA pseudouridine38-40 synthase|nr:tRNA pseudouridine(38-40) synthase TruA [Gammaproteobacteria bacterium]